MVEAMRDGNIPAEMIKTHSSTLDELPVAMTRWCHDRAELVKAMVELPGVRGVTFARGTQGRPSLTD